MSKSGFKEQLRIRNVSNTPEARRIEELGDHFDSNRNRKGWTNAYKKPQTNSVKSKSGFEI